MITIVDYGLGNVSAFVNTYKRLNITARVAQRPDELLDATRLILPGVGAFDKAMERLDRSGMRAVLDELVLSRRIPVLGICVGMQMLADESEEGQRAGLGWVPGRVRHLGTKMGPALLPLPHMGWNDVSPSAGEKLFRGMEDGCRFYFLHSFYFECSVPTEHTAGQTHYGIDFSCAVRAGHVAGVQFHPEKSHRWGIRLLQNFAQEDSAC